MSQDTNSHINSRQRIITAALREFADHGLAGARVDRIARQARINKAMIYYHFSSKERLYRQVLEDNLRKIAASVRIRIEQADNIEEFLLFLSDFYHQHVDLKSGFGRIVLREMAAGGELFRNLFSEIISGYNLREKMKQLMLRGTEAGRFRKIDFRHAMISFIGMNLFYLLLTPLVNTIWEIDNETEFKKERPQILVDLFMHGLEAK